MSLELGGGTVSLFAVATIDGKPVRSNPLELTIVAQVALPAVESDAGEELADGLLLTFAGGKPVVVSDTRDAKWLEKSGLKPRQRYTVTATFEVETDDVYQFQLHSSEPVHLKIDDGDLASLAPKARSAGRWQFIPIRLKKGRHRLELTGATGAKPALEVRFGSRGTYRLDGKRFRHQMASD
jgi:hypothetical protein